MVFVIFFLTYFPSCDNLCTIIICRSLFSYGFGGQEYEIEVLAGPHRLWRPYGKTPALPLPGFGGSWHSFTYGCLTLIAASSSPGSGISLPLTLLRTLVIEFRTHLDNPDKPFLSKSLT